MNGVFQPGTGALSGFYESTLKNLLQRQGPGFVPNPSAGINFTPAFLSFFNRAMQFSETVYPGGSPQPKLTFTMRPYPVDGIQTLTLSMGSQSMPSPGAPRQFVWTGAELDQVRLTGKVGGSEFSFLTYNGPWAIFEFFNNAERMQNTGNLHSVEWVPKTSGQPFMLNDKPLTVHYDLELAGAPVFQKGYLPQMRCVAEVAR
jgi:type VI protein secretion system component VasK